jgi:3-phosphoshikimate 1-carboxyvinyltransferase (EC 2.5.1.19)
MDVRIGPAALEGTVRAPPSKSYSHRAILAGGYSDSATVTGALESADTAATRRAIEAFGASVTDTTESGEMTIAGFDGTPAVPPDVLDCANSGTTMRLVTATAGLVDGYTVLTGDASLRSRPQGPLLAALEALGGTGLSVSGDGTAPLVIGGPVPGGAVTVPGDVSSQFISALLMAGAVTAEGVEITLSSPAKSAPYIQITLEVLAAFGVRASATDAGYQVRGAQRYRRGDPYTVPGDFSSISYLAALGALCASEPLTIEGATPSAQGDTAIIPILEEMGADVSWDRDAATVRVGAAPLAGVSIDVGDTPDLLPTLAVLGAFAEGQMCLENCGHVRLKETDRVAVMAAALTRLGVDVEEEETRLCIGAAPAEMGGVTLRGAGDHRIIMALSVLATAADRACTIRGAEHVAVSYPHFFDALEGLGGHVERG